ncbi:MAG: GNAT family N-acetyltransferase [Thermoguttaceae bacterium]|jgi:CelD/BcsL family acetyltransferase involved in cellulose biosynthesis
MHIHLLKSLDELAPYTDAWDRLAAEAPFRSWTWLSHWWQCYGPTKATRKANPALQLAVPAVFDESDTLVGLAPWYLDCSVASGRVLRMLGTGEVCSDYLSLLCQRGMEASVIESIADFLLDAQADYLHDGLFWDLILLDGVDFEDHAVNSLAAHLSGHGCKVHRRQGLNCWRLDLPASWEEYLKTLSRSYRRQIRRLEDDYFKTGRAILHGIERIDDLPWAIDLLIDMHQRRRQSLGDAGSFASPRFTAFIRGVLPELMRQGRLQFHWLELDGRPAALEYHLAGGGVLYAYQAGVEPEAMEFQPGKLLNLATIRRAIEQGYRVFDFLRGDEPYKAHFRAAPRPSLELRIVPNRPSARLRHNLWLAGSRVKQWMKKGLVNK